MLRVSASAPHLVFLGPSAPWVELCHRAQFWAACRSPVTLEDEGPPFAEQMGIDIQMTKAAP